MTCTIRPLRKSSLIWSSSSALGIISMMGNKRIALTLGAYFLHKNGYPWEACIFMRQLEAIVYHVAASHIDQDLLLRIMTAFMSGKDYDEELEN